MTLPPPPSSSDAQTRPPASAVPPTPPAWHPIESIQRRVLGVLIEKAKTTPAGYPLTLNSVVAGCNQKSNREPVMELDDGEVERGLDQLCKAGAASEVYDSGRVTKYRHHGYAWLGVDKPEIAVMTELLLRGEQTLGDLRVRAARMEPIPDQAALKPIVAALVERGLMIELTPPGRGQIVTHNLYPEYELAQLRARFGGAGAGRPVAAESAAPPALARERGATPERFTAMAAELDALRAEVARLDERVRELEQGRERGSAYRRPPGRGSRRRSRYRREGMRGAAATPDSVAACGSA